MDATEHEHMFLSKCSCCSWPRERIYTGQPHEFGYHQMFEELFEAHEEKLPPRAMDAYSRSEWPSVPRTKLKMNSQYEAFNPHLRHIDVSYKCAAVPTSVSE